MLTVRLPSDLETEINRLASTEKKTKSEIIKDAIRQYIASHRNRNSSYELGHDLFGIVSSGDTSRSKTYKKWVKDRLSEKHAH
jgi:metal-responsive CopG/Arc/MetJ family transcriptional regulator